MVSAVAHGAQWSIAPNFSLAVDTDSNRGLSPEGADSQSETFSTSGQFDLATEANDLSFSPLLRWQDFDTQAFQDIFERDFNIADTWTQERGRLVLSAEDADRSTLTTEATETGILSTSLHQKLDQVSVGETYSQSERWALVLQGSYSDTSYYGTSQSALLNLLLGYRYPMASIGEQLQLTEASSLTASVFYGQLLNRIPGQDTKEGGVTVDYRASLSERTQLDASVGATHVDTAGNSRISETGSISLSRSFDAGSLTLAYADSLTPYGSGALVQRQQVTLSASRNLTERLNLVASASRVQNGQSAASTQLGAPPEVQTYDNAQLDLVWQLAEYWKLDAGAGAIHTRTVGVESVPVNEWRFLLQVSWSPHALTSSF